MKKSAVLSLTVYSLLHFAVDFTCATVMFAKVLPHGELWAVAMLLYNYFAFAMQLPFGIIADKLNKNSLVAGLGCALVAMGCFFSAFPLAAAVLCGIGNGLFVPDLLLRTHGFRNNGICFLLAGFCLALDLGDRGNAVFWMKLRPVGTSHALFRHFSSPRKQFAAFTMNLFVKKLTINIK